MAVPGFRRLTERLFRRAKALLVPGGRRVSSSAASCLLLSGVGFLLPVIGSVPALICGHVARRRFRAEPTLRGRGLAIAGLVIGYASLAYSLYILAMIAWVALHRGA
jgi:hypothetical protein